MAKKFNVRFAKELQRNDEQKEQHQWAWIRNELSAGANAAESEFVALDAESLLAAAKKRKKASSR